ncbi:MAG: ribosomal protein S18-alanine N-acetyltransferase [Deltaproteobacteria bacterium]|nr:ribosomal protein S18-alanine N-acetyltransferase [Deltaproteobacteria bacterium]
MMSLVEITHENFYRYEADILGIERVSFPSPWSPPVFRQEIARPGSHLWVLIIDDALTGYICFWMLSAGIHVMNMAVHPLRRGRGLGLDLLTRMIEKGASHGVETAWLEVRPSNRIARRLYKKAGFKEMDRMPRYYTDTKEDAIVMTLHLFHKVGDGVTRLGQYLKNSDQEVYRRC